VYLTAVVAAGAIGLGLVARGLFVQYPSVEWHMAVVRTLSGLGVVVPILLISYLVLRASVARAEDTSRHLKEVNRVYLSTVETLATAIDATDQVRSHHIRRVQNYALSLARAVGIGEESELRAIEAAVLLHDMGKLSVPASILNKPGKLTPAEFERVKQHATVAAQILSQIDFPYPVVPVVRHHHERWDGTGYPDGLKGEAIPLGARVMAVVDSYDALTSRRPYRPAIAGVDALGIILEQRGSVYDPRVVDAFVAVIAQFTDSAPAAHDAGEQAPVITLSATPMESRGGRP
jgi:putative nucleotidyltransferase with HDIG domain